jgi:hypothetical protein
MQYITSVYLYNPIHIIVHFIISETKNNIYYRNFAFTFAFCKHEETKPVRMREYADSISMLDKRGV